MIRRFALLQTFVAVARAGKMKQAAHELALTSGAVSQRIAKLEEGDWTPAVHANLVLVWNSKLRVKPDVWRA